MVNVAPRPIYLVREAKRATGPVWTGPENLSPTGVESRTVQAVASRFKVDTR
jgi:hypothetical protein